MSEEVQMNFQREEPLLRRFLPEPFSSAIPAAAFRPTREDTTGISVSFQDRFADPLGRILADTRKPASSYSVCRFNLVGFGELSIDSSPTVSDPGHATIPEISPPYDELAKSDERKKRLKDWQEALRRRAIVIHNAGASIGG